MEAIPVIPIFSISGLQRAWATSGSTLSVIFREETQEGSMTYLETHNQVVMELCLKLMALDSKQSILSSTWADFLYYLSMKLCWLSKIFPSIPPRCCITIPFKSHALPKTSGRRDRGEDPKNSRDAACSLREHCCHSHLNNMQEESLLHRLQGEKYSSRLFSSKF